ncbi:MAG: hypothetical protein ACKPKO_16810, partial [Candidatus Fonsibacter sp.]
RFIFSIIFNMSISVIKSSSILVIFLNTRPTLQMVMYNSSLDLVYNMLDKYFESFQIHQVIIKKNITV